MAFTVIGVEREDGDLDTFFVLADNVHANWTLPESPMKYYGDVVKEMVNGKVFGIPAVEDVQEIMESEWTREWWVEL